MSVEIRQMLIKSTVVQGASDGQDAPAEAASSDEAQPLRRDWRAECRRLIGEVLDERKER